LTPPASHARMRQLPPPVLVNTLPPINKRACVSRRPVNALDHSAWAAVASLLFTGAEPDTHHGIAMQAQDLEPERPVSFLQSAALNPIKLLKLDAHAVGDLAERYIPGARYGHALAFVN
jgi:hypothetical protein